MPHGIGGDIVYPPHMGLNYVDMTAGNSDTLFLTSDFNPVGLSPDLTWIAYMPADSGFVQGGNVNLTFYNLYTTVMIEVPLRSSSDRGAGYAVFSPDNQYVAWMESSGTQMAEVPTFHSKVMVADISGNIILELDDNVIASYTGTPNATWAQPVGWLDGEYLLVQVRGENWLDVSLMRVRFDASDIAFLAPGEFAGFFYP
jgi:hypothetical protein